MQPAVILDELIETIPDLSSLRDPLWSAYELMVCCCERGGVILCCGNGGSAADADHIVGELMKSFRIQRRLPKQDAMRFCQAPQLLEQLHGALPAISLCAHTALLTAFGNDASAEYAFAQQVYGYASRTPALLIALSTSGNSRNVLHAAQAANCLGCSVIGVTGQTGGQLCTLCDVCLRMPSNETYRIQEYTLPVYHALCAMVEARFFIPG